LAEARPNHPPYFPRDNGAMGQTIRDLEEHLDERGERAPTVPLHLAAQIETSVRELNHRPRRCLKSRRPCAVFQDDASLASNVELDIREKLRSEESR
jgi:hypothetical protein